jgi:hypothetical protein
MMDKKSCIKISSSEAFSAAQSIIAGIKEENEALRQEVKNIIKERDEARKMYCEHIFGISPGDHVSTRSIARENGWDCYDDFCENFTAPNSPVEKTIKGKIVHVKSEVPFYGDDDHYNTPIPEHVLEKNSKDALCRLNKILHDNKSNHKNNLDENFISVIEDSIKEINYLRTKVFEFEINNGNKRNSGYVPEDVMMRNQELVIENDSLRKSMEEVVKEKESIALKLREARREICHFSCGEDLWSYKGQTPIEVAYYQGWDCFQDD